MFQHNLCLLTKKQADSFQRLILRAYVQNSQEIQKTGGADTHGTSWALAVPGCKHPLPRARSLPGCSLTRSSQQRRPGVSATEHKPATSHGCTGKALFRN